jgi:hypothetical protein
MVTPTFAAGLGVVVAAGLTLNMPRAVLHFGDPDQVTPCAVRGCEHDVPGGGTLASAKPGVQLARPAPRGSAATGHGAAVPSPAPDRQPGGSQVTLAYHTTQRWSGGFTGQITISGLPGPQQGPWRLAFDYPGASILGVTGAQWQSAGPDAGVATGGPEAGPGQPGKGGVVITVMASGPPGPPSGCRFDDAPCTFR